MVKRIFQYAIYIIFGVIVFAAPALLAQEKSLIEVQSEVDTSINRDKDLRIMKPGEGLNLGMFEIKDYKFHDPVEKDGRLIEKYDFTISVYDTGKFTIPPFPVAYFPVDTSQHRPGRRCDNVLKLSKPHPLTYMLNR